MKSDEDIINDSNATISIINIEKLCRLCLLERENLNGIFENNFVDLILLCANVEVTCSIYETLNLNTINKIIIFKLNSDDGLPSNICNECLDRANRAIEFRTECERSDVILHQWLNLNVDSNDEIEDIDVDGDKQEDSENNFDLVNILVEYPRIGMSIEHMMIT